MSRANIDYGIDLGTTNSSVAVASGTTTEVIRNALDSEITPSAVYINPGGTLWVGQHARSRLADERAAGQVASEFKRRIGTGYEYNFEANARVMRPEELSAEVLKSLRADVARSKGEDITAAVITVPAAFEIHQCEATSRAAALAGFKHSALLQEPVAAALAYGYQKTDARACWLVFDFGGGTFDAALVSARGGLMHVINHGGDSFLGGADLDWAIVQQILMPRIQKEFDVEDFRRGSARYHNDLIRLKAAAEEAKIELSTKTEAHLEVVLGSGNNRLFTFETTLSRAEISRVAEPIALKAADIALRVLKEKNLAAGAVSKLVFVGGPTIAPWFREIVQTRLAIPADCSIDPLTAVARGAAIFASTQPLPKVSTGVSRPPIPTNDVFPVEILAKKVGSDPEPLVGGRVQPTFTSPIKGFTIEFVNPVTKWRSGRQPLRDGAFQLTLRAEPAVQNRFAIELRSSSGAICATSPAHFDYTVGVVIEEQPIINNLGVAMADNKVSTHFSKGQPLPARSMRSYRTSRELRRGDTSDALHIPIVEGNRPLADRNILIGSLHIRAENLNRDLPAGSEIEVTLKMDASRLLSVQAFVPMLDAEFPATIELGGKIRQPNPAVLGKELARENMRLQEMQVGAGSAPQAWRDTLQQLENSPLRAQLMNVISGEHPIDFDSLLRAERDLMEYKDKLDELAAALEWPAAVEEAGNWLYHLNSVAEAQGNGEDRERAAALRVQTQELIDAKSLERLRRKITELSEVYSAILQRQPGFWAEYLENLASRHEQMRDQVRAGLLIKRGRHAGATGDTASVKEVVFQLQDLLPRAAAAQARMGYGSSLVQ